MNQAMLIQQSRRRFRLLMPIAALLALSFAAGKCAPALQSEIRAEDARAIVQVLASNSFGGRESGTSSARRAAQWISDFYRREGLFPAFEGAYLQRFQFQSGVIPAPDSGLLWNVNGRTKRLPGAPLPLTAPGAASGEGIFLGHCLQAKTEGVDDFAGQDLRNRVVFCLRYAPGGVGDARFARAMSFQDKLRAAREAGAAAIVFVNLPAGRSVDPRAFAPSQGQGPRAIFIEAQTLTPHLPWLEQAAADLRTGKGQAWIGKRLGAVTVRAEFAPRKMPAANVGAWLRRPQDDDRVIIVGAHFDHLGRGAFASLDRGEGLHVGADDNASGVAAVMEIAAELRRRDRLQQSSRLAEGYNVLFLNFDAEERGLFGATEFVKSYYFEADRTVAMLNLDMVGRLREGKGLMVQGAQSGDARWQENIREAFAAAGFGDSLELRLLPGGSGPSDHTVFYTRKTPVAMFFTGGHREYHTSRDLPSTLNYDGIAAISRMATELIVRTGGLQPPLAYVRAPAEPSRAGFEFRLRLGIMPASYDNDGKGLEVGDVQPEAPVARLGLKPGDRIVELGGKNIGGINDYMEFRPRRAQLSHRICAQWPTNYW